MARKYRWPGESGPARHSIPYSQHQKNTGARTVTLARPPAGSYDVDLDAQERAARRGYENTLEDTGLQRERGATDFGLGQQELERQRGDVTREHGESLSDLIRSRTQGQQDYQTSLQGIARNFQRLGNVQAQQGRKAGLRGGFAAQAQRKRAGQRAARTRTRRPRLPALHGGLEDRRDPARRSQAAGHRRGRARRWRTRALLPARR